MIDYQETHKRFGYHKPKFRKPVVVICDKCGISTKINYRERLRDSNGAYKCPSCVARERWEDEEYKQKTLQSQRTATAVTERSEKSKARWIDDNYRNKISRAMREKWQDQEYAATIAESCKVKWLDSEYRNKITKAMRSDDVMRKILVHPSRSNKVSNLQSSLYAILDNLGVQYFREYDNGPDDPECCIGPYSFDCVIPRDHKPDLLIEVQGEYWHSSREAVRRDQAKATYIENLSDYELKYLFENDFCLNKIRQLLLYWLDNKSELVEFEFDDVIIAEVTKEEYKKLFGAYHYLPNCRRGGVCFGAYIHGNLAAACLFSSIIRQNITIDGFGSGSIREISRFCIAPEYQKKCFASWFLSKCLKLISAKVIVAYSDKTFNHDGVIYKACNFICDKIIPPDYIYKCKDGWAMHKKTLYNQAKACHMTEKQYAEKHGFVKCFGREKRRYIYYL